MRDWVYFIREQGGAVKIGHTRDVGGRLRSLQSANSRQLTVLGIVAGDCRLERELHERFFASRIRGEWFDYSDDMADFIRTVAVPHEQGATHEEQDAARSESCSRVAQITASLLFRTWITVERAAEITTLPESLLYQQMRAGRLEYTVVGDCQRIPLDDLERMMEAGKVARR